MKIAFLTARLSRYGAISQHTVSVMKEIARSFDVCVFTFDIQDESCLGALTRHRVRVFFLGNRHAHTFQEELRVTGFPLTVAREIAENDLLVISTDRPVITPVILAKFFNRNLKVVWDFHGITPLNLRLPLGFWRCLVELYRIGMAKVLMRYCDCCIVHSEFIRREVISTYGALRTVVIPYGVDMERFRLPESRRTILRKYKLDKDFVLLYVGRLVPHKRIHVIVKALAGLKDPGIGLVIVGSGSEEGRLREYVCSLNLGDSVVFTGELTDEELVHMYSECDVFVTASEDEGVCVPILESFVSRKPVIVTNSSAMPETADGGGLIWDGSSTEDLARKIRILKSDRKLYLKLGETGWHAVGKHDVRRTSMQYERFFKNLAGKCCRRVCPLDAEHGVGHT